MLDRATTTPSISCVMPAYNEAGSARYQLAKARQHLAYLQSTVAHESLEAQHQRIRALDRTNEKKRQMVGQTEEPAP